MKTHKSLMITIGGSLTLTIAIVIGIIFFIQFYSSTYLCTALERKIAKLENLMIHEPLLLQEAKAYLEKKIKKQQALFNQRTKQSDKAIIANYKITLKDELYILQTKQNALELSLKQTDAALIQEKKDILQEQQNALQKKINEQKKLLAQLPSLALAATVKTSKQEEIQESIIDMEKELEPITSMLKKADKEILASYKNELEQEQIIINKHKQMIQKLLTFAPQDFLVVAKKEQKGQWDRIAQELESLKKSLSLPEKEMMQDAKNRINKEILSLKIKALHNRCK